MELRDLQRMTVVKLREEAFKSGQVVGAHGMQKPELIEALAQVYGMDLEAAARAARESSAVDKTSLKQGIRALKVQRNEALGSHDGARLQQMRQGIKTRKRRLRRLAEQNRTTAV